VTAAPAQSADSIADFRLDGRVVILTGASSGLGARWVPVLGAAGARVVLFARREKELAAVAQQACGSLTVVGDITSEDDRRRLVDSAMATFGRIDVLINGAGTAASAPALETTAEALREMLEVNLVSAFAVSRLVGRIMIESGRGSIINVASLAAERAVDRYPLVSYAASKAGLVSITRSLAAEWGPRGVRVNAISPAFFPTRLSGFLQDRDQVTWIAHRVPVKRPAHLHELDGTVLFLASDASTYVTGQDLVVDGGWTVY
jgi:NAD(P)-dependent dehydrogenase (short-subunit alcohol dehydrogenase family)